MTSVRVPEPPAQGGSCVYLSAGVCVRVCMHVYLSTCMWVCCKPVEKAEAGCVGMWVHW